jgi:hypothetical protein
LRTISLLLARIYSLACQNLRLSAIAAPAPELIEFFRTLSCPDSKIQAMLDGLPVPTRAAKKAPGGQPANANALKHGVYASLYNSADRRYLEENKKPNIDADLALLTEFIKRSAAFFFDLKNPLTLAEYESGARVIDFAFAVREKLIRTKVFVLGGGANNLQRALDEGLDAALAAVPAYEEDPDALTLKASP